MRILLLVGLLLPYAAPAACTALGRMDMPMGCDGHGAMAMVGPASSGMGACQLPACGLAHGAPPSLVLRLPVLSPPVTDFLRPMALDTPSPEFAPPVRPPLS